MQQEALSGLDSVGWAVLEWNSQCHNVGNLLYLQAERGGLGQKVDALQGACSRKLCVGCWAFNGRDLTV